MSDENIINYADLTKASFTYGPSSITGVAQRPVGTVLRFTPQPATVTTTCTRCSATIDPAAVEQHHERCFVVGDAVRVSRPLNVEGGGWWVEGELLSVDRNATDGFDGRIRVSDASLERKKYVGTERSFSWGNTNTIRHIQRPGRVGWMFRCQGDRGGKQCEKYAGPPADMGWRCPNHELQDAVERIALPSEDPWEQDPMDALYDGVTLRVLLECDEAARREAGPHWQNGSQRTWTASQREAVSAYHSQQLRARISAAKERERLSVTYCEVDVEDEPW